MASLKKCIELKCKDCCYDPMDQGTWREQSERCTVKTCPLWEVRPMTVATITLHRKHRGEDDVNGIIDILEDEERIPA